MKVRKRSAGIQSQLDQAVYPQPPWRSVIRAPTTRVSPRNPEKTVPKGHRHLFTRIRRSQPGEASTHSLRKTRPPLPLPAIRARRVPVQRPSHPSPTNPPRSKQTRTRKIKTFLSFYRRRTSLRNPSLRKAHRVQRRMRMLLVCSQRQLPSRQRPLDCS